MLKHCIVKTGAISATSSVNRHGVLEFPSGIGECKMGFKPEQTLMRQRLGDEASLKIAT